ncbi:MAG: isoprenyl transferase [Gammaproteobacteria bacterium]|jgi:undecaprenyl diphosphate synthase
MSTDKPTLPGATNGLPRHVAIIMDGNGRWAKKRLLPRIAGHRAGVETVRQAVKACAEKGIEVLTLFAFSSENWRRPAKEVSLLMELFLTALQRESRRLHANNVKLKIIGDRSAFAPRLQEEIAKAEELSRDNTGLTLVIAANYGGRWDVVQAARHLGEQIAAGKLQPKDISPEMFEAQLALYGLPEPDLFIRTGGEQRISNFLLWHLAYTELYFTDTLWPDFDAQAFENALSSYATRQRRFGRTGDQVELARGD